MDLKTLKDLKGIFANGGKIYVELDQLKAEAVKWVKVLDNSIDMYKFMAFHNITEEDLKW